MLPRLLSTVSLVLVVVAPIACKPSECEGVVAAAAPVQELAMNGSAADLAEQATKLEAAAAGTDNKEIQWLVASTRQLADHVKAGSQPGVEVPNYSENKAMYLDRVVEARRSVGALCQ